MKSMSFKVLAAPAGAAAAACLATILVGCAAPAPMASAPAQTRTPPPASAASPQLPPVQRAAPAGATVPAAAQAQPNAGQAPRVAVAAQRPEDLPTPEPVPFETAVERAARRLVDQAAAQVGPGPRTVIIDPLVDANTGAQTVSTDNMGRQLARLVAQLRPEWTVKPLTRATLQEKPLLLIGTLTANTARRSVDTVPDGFRVWLSAIDLRTGTVVAKQLDRSTVDSVNPEPLKFFADSPTWHRDRTVEGYINSCQVKTAIGDPADPDYLARLPAVAVVNEAIAAYASGRMPQARSLYEEAATLADKGDLRVLNGLYLTNWQLGARDKAKDAFGRLVASGLELKRLPIKMLFTPGTTQFQAIGDLPQQYAVWLDALSQQARSSDVCINVVGHTSRTGSAVVNERLSRQRAETIKALLERNQRTLATRLRASGVGSKEALVGLGTDDLRDALDRRVEFRVVGCV